MVDDSGTPPSTARRTQRTVPIRRSRARRQAQPQPDKLQFLPLDEWDEHNSYDEDEPTCLHYSIEWKVYVNGRMVLNDTEQDLVLAPTAYWHMLLKPKLEKLLRRKLAQNRSVQCDETNVVVSATGRSERDLTKRFDDIDIDWSIVEKQLLAWGELFRSGKKLRVDLDLFDLVFNLKFLYIRTHRIQKAAVTTKACRAKTSGCWPSTAAASAACPR
jgi:hypothetical protein